MTFVPPLNEPTAGPGVRFVATLRSYLRSYLATENDGRRRQRATLIALGVLILAVLGASVGILTTGGGLSDLVVNLGVLVTLLILTGLNLRFPRVAAWGLVLLIAVVPYASLQSQNTNSGGIFSISVLLAAVVLHPVVALVLGLIQLIAGNLIVADWSFVDTLVLFAVTMLGCLLSSGLLAMAESFRANAEVLEATVTDLADQGANQAELLEVQQHQTSELQALLSTVHALDVSLVTITEQVTLVPLVGVYTVERVQHLRAALLKKLSQSRTAMVILDFTAQLDVGATTLQEVRLTIQSAHLLGTQVALTGIPSTLARQLVEQSIDLGTAQIYRTIGEALSNIVVTTVDSGYDARN